MTTIVLIDKTGTVKQSKVKDLTRDTLYRKCGFRKSEGFEKQTTWEVSVGGTEYNVELWARAEGKANTENKYDFPPPCDVNLFFGTCGLINCEKDGDGFEDITVENWTKIYEKLFGGFEDIGDAEEESEDELASVPKEMKTKGGYLKDGFVVDTNSDDDDEALSEAASDVGSDDDDDEGDEGNDDDDDSDCTPLASDDEDDEDDGSGSELGEEAYGYSSDEQ